MTPAELAQQLPKPLESVQAALNLARIPILPSGHIDMPPSDSPGWRLFIAHLVKQPDNEATRLLRDIRNSGCR